MRQTGRNFLRYGAAILLTAVALFVRLALNQILRSQLPFVTFYPAIIASAWYFGRGPGFAAALLASVSALTVFYPPIGSGMPDSAQLVTVFVFLLFTCALVILVDIALRARDRAERSESEVRALNAGLGARVRDFETLLHVAPVALLVALDRDCSEIRMNAAAEALLGMPAGGNPSKITRNGVELPPESLPLQTAAREGIASSGEALEIRRADGEVRQIVSHSAPLHDESGNVRGAVAALVDLTAQKQAEAESARQARDLARSSDDLRQFAYAASHDLQEPLRTVVVYSQLLERRYAKDLDADGRTFLDFVIGGGRRLERLLSDLREYWRVGAADETPVQPVNSAASLARALANLSASLSQSGVRVVAGKLPAVMAHEVALVQLFQNLVGNAIKYRAEAPLLIEVKGAAKGGFCEFEVTDNGRGIDPRYQEQVFEMFRRLDHGPNAGSGIGLALCRKIVERYDGRIWVESEPGRGSTFRFLLPAVPPQAAARES